MDDPGTITLIVSGPGRLRGQMKLAGRLAGVVPIPQDNAGVGPTRDLMLVRGRSEDEVRTTLKKLRSGLSASTCASLWVRRPGGPSMPLAEAVSLPGLPVGAAPAPGAQTSRSRVAEDDLGERLLVASTRGWPGLRRYEKARKDKKTPAEALRTVLDEPPVPGRRSEARFVF